MTGASGFVGRHLVSRLLVDGWDVSVLCRSEEGCARLPAACRVFVGNILDAALGAVLSSQRFDVIFHLAGLNPSGAAAELYRINVLGTAKLLEAIRALGRPALKLVLLGSSAQYGAAKDDPITEESATAPVTNYGVSKACADLMGQVLFGETGQGVLRARAFNIIGPGQGPTSLQGRVVEQIVAIERGLAPPVIETGSLNAYRDFIDVRDVAGGLLAVARGGVAGEAYNLCSGVAVQASSLVERLLALSSVRLELRVGRQAAGRADVTYQRGSFEKLHRLEGGWAPAWTLEQSLRDGFNHGRQEAARSSGKAAAANNALTT